MVGALIGILTAPSSGRETREKLKNTSKKFVEDNKDKIESAKRGGSE